MQFSTKYHAFRIRYTKKCKIHNAQDIYQSKSYLKYIQKAMTLYELQKETLENLSSAYYCTSLSKKYSWYNISKYIWLEIPFSTILHLSKDSKDKDSKSNSK